MVANLIFEYSAWWIPLCLLMGAIYAAILYRNVKVPWSQSTSYVMAGTRFLLVSLIGILLISPFLNQTENTFEKPLVVIAMDNSQSMAMIDDSTNLQALSSTVLGIGTELEQTGYNVVYRDLVNKNIEPSEDILFDQPQTDLAKMLKDIENDFEGRNLSSVILVTDGIYTRGTSPTFTNLTYPVNTIGAGDTVPKQDLIIKNLLYNKVTYQGNQFPIIAEVINEGFINEPVKISVIRNGKSIASASLLFSRNNQLQQVEFKIDAEENGLQRYSIVLEEKKGEFTYVNNYKQGYVDIIDGKEKILIAAPSPHPDIKAISAALEKNENYEVSLFIPGIHDYPAEEMELDLIIYHQVPDSKRVMGPYQSRINELNLPTMTIIGSQTSIILANNQIAPIQFKSPRNEGDLVTAVVNPDFTFFNLSEELEEFLRSYPPVRVPFGQVEMDAESSALLNQRVGSIETTRPLLIFRNGSDAKSAVLLGEGLWQWRMFEYSKKDHTRLFDELILKSVQFLASKEDRRKFRVYPRQNEFFENEPVILESEVYNSLYDPIYGIKIDLTIGNDLEGESAYTYVTSESNSKFVLRDLETGVYTYSAKAIVNDKPEEVRGQFLVKAMDLEAINLTADHGLLRQLSNNSGGKFYLPNRVETLQADLISIKPPDIIHSSEKILPLINLMWVFFLLLSLISTEWFLRKYNGGY